MSTMRSLAIHFANYSAASVLGIAASFISFPLLTRLLSVSDYGIVSLVSSILAFVISASKMGLQHSTLRFYSDMRSGRNSFRSGALLSTSVFGMLGLGLVATAVCLLVTQLAPGSWWADPQVKSVMLVASVLVVVRVVESAFINQWRAEERSGALSIYQVLRKYFDLAFIVFALYHVSRSVWGFYAAAVVSESLGMMVLVVLTLRRLPLALTDFSAPLFKALLAFGVPMLGYELLSVLSLFGDRYVIQHLMSTADLGIFSAAYNLADSLRAALIVSMTAAAVPMYNRLFVDAGAEQTSRFLSQVVRVYSCAIAALLALLAAVGTDAVVMLASEKYRAAGAVLPLIVGGMAIDNLSGLIGAGLYLQKKTSVILKIVIASALLKLALSVLLIPHLGIAAAAVSSVIAGVALLIGLGLASRPYLQVQMPFGAMLKFAAIGVVTFVVMRAIPIEAALLRVALRSAVGVLVFCVLAIAMDTALRGHVAQTVAAWRARRRPI